MLKKAKVIFVLFIVIGMIVSSISNVNAHSVELDPESLISMPTMLFGGSGTITIKDSVTNYTLYFQAVKIPNTVYSQIEKVQSDGKKDLDNLKKEYTALKTEVDNLKTTYEQASDAYQAGITNNVSEAELETLKTAYETAKTNYQTKAIEYSNKVKAYNDKVDEINNKIKQLTPTYVESNWIQTTDNKVSIDTTEFSGQQAYSVWVKLVTSGKTYYDEAIYTMTGNKPENVSIESVSLDKTSVSIEKGSTYTLTAMINPTDATNKSVKWQSDNENVATVSNGKVMGIAEGTANITVTTEDGNHTATCKVTVTKKTNAGNSDTEKNETEDKTVANGKLPKAGSNGAIIIGMIVITLVAIIMYKKYNNYKDIK